MINTLIQISLAVLAIFLILLVLVQRGKGGGLAGVLGGSGGSSAFGAKAGDVFTRITIVTAAIWIILCAGSLAKFGNSPDAAQTTFTPQNAAGEGGAILEPSSDDATGGSPDATPPAGDGGNDS